MGKLSSLAGVREFPVRVKCASLAWHTLKAAMDQQDRSRRVVDENEESTDDAAGTAAAARRRATRPPRSSPIRRRPTRCSRRSRRRSRRCYDPGDPGRHLRARADLRRVRRPPTASPAIRMTLTAPAARPRRSCRAGRPTRRRRCAGIDRRESGRRLGAGLDQGPDVGRRETAAGDVVNAATVKKSRLRADGDETPRHQDRLRVRLDQRARDRRAVRHPHRADGEGAAAAGAERPAHLAPGHARRLHACRSRPPSISVADIIQAIDGPLTVTACSTEDEQCEQFTKCNVRDPLWRIKDRILSALSTCSLAEISTDCRTGCRASMPMSLSGGRNPLVSWRLLTCENQ